MSWYNYRLESNSENPTPQIDISGADIVAIDTQGPWPTGAGMTVEVSIDGNIWTTLFSTSPTGPESHRFTDLGAYRFLRIRPTGSPPIAWCVVGIYRRSVS